MIRRARRRVVWNELLSALSFAASLALGAIVLLLLFGTQILDWRLMAVLCLAGLGITLFRTMRRVPSPYRLAVAVDRRAGLQDSLSTALFFEDPAHEAETAPVRASQVRAAQKAQAEALVDRIDLSQAVPFTLPKTAYAVAALGLIASSLFALRYGAGRRLDLKPPLTTILMDSFGFATDPAKDSVTAQKRKQAGNAANPGPSASLGMTIPQSQQKRPEGLDAAPDSVLDTVGIPEANNDKGGEKGGSGKKGGPAKTEGAEKADGEKGDPESPGEGSAATAGKNASDNPAGSRDGPQQGEQAGGKQASSGENSSLMSKLKDAMSNLLSKAKPQPNNAGGQKPSAAQGGQKAQAQKPSGNEKGATGQGQQAGGKESAEAQDGQQAGDSENDQNAPGKGSGQSSDRQTAAQPGSGIGKQDGSKDLKAAEQLAAMGKLSEIIGKRSANVSGEMTIEAPSGPQQLHTAYSRSSAKHGESGGEVSRDEVPVELQPYVQQYFEEIRKAPAPAARGRIPAQ
ncbi:MAG: hypothetical protein M3Z85_02605 [Acidobacteriota bacterium]|nr:hypothetical protein [Acidobacteriota bacterium]